MPSICLSTEHNDIKFPYAVFVIKESHILIEAFSEDTK